MKILLANKFFYPRGGDCIHTLNLKQLLEQNGHDVAVFSMQFPENIESEYSKYWPSEVNFSSKAPTKLMISILRPFGIGTVKKKWNMLLKDFQPDIVHLQNIHSQLSPVIAREAKKQNIPVIWTLHDYKLICPAYLFKDNKGAICEDCLQNPKAVMYKKCIKGSKLASTLGYLEAKKWSGVKLQHYTNTFLAPSAFLKSKMVKAGFPENIIVHIYNFADNIKFENKVLEKRKKEVIYVGRLSKEKGIETLCKAFQGISDVNLTIIGDGPLKTMLEEQYASEEVRFTGFQLWEMIKEKLGQAACLIIPSECYENNPLTIIEAFALGTPVLGSNIGGIPELIVSNTNGLLCKVGDIQDLQAGIKQMFKTDWDYQQIQVDAKKKFSQRQYYSELMRLYQSA